MEEGEDMGRGAAAKVEYRAKYSCAKVGAYYQVSYFCAFCDFHYTVAGISASSGAEAAAMGEPEARKHFNGCRKCGRWVCDGHFIMEKMLCPECGAAARGEVAS
jgi:hypothetical protein